MREFCVIELSVLVNTCSGSIPEYFKFNDINSCRSREDKYENALS